MSASARGDEHSKGGRTEEQPEHCGKKRCFTFVGPNSAFRKCGAAKCSPAACAAEAAGTAVSST